MITSCNGPNNMDVLFNSINSTSLLNVIVSFFMEQPQPQIYQLNFGEMRLNKWGGVNNKCGRNLLNRTGVSCVRWQRRLKKVITLPVIRDGGKAGCLNCLICAQVEIESVLDP